MAARMDTDFLARRVGDFLEDVAAPTPAPSGGAVAAIAVALGAGLVEMAARFSDGRWSEAPRVAAQAAALRERAAPLAQADADGYAPVLSARGEDVADALEAATAVPLEVAAIAAEVAGLAAEVTEHGNPNLRGDAAAGAALADAAARAAANLVAINLKGSPEDARTRRAGELAAAASEAAGRALGTPALL
jgi:formiminotetrahydrofolate cyclodeaminase